jgi:lysophospholipase L1-like esterase
VDHLTISFYGDSITWLNLYEPLIVSAIGASPYTRNLSVRVFNQGVNGGTVKDVVKGYSPWGHLNPSRPLANTTFLQTLDEDKPNVVVLQIGINDVWQAGPDCGDRCSNVTEFVRVVREEIAAPVAARGALLVLASVSTIGEAPGGVNPHDAALDAFAAAQQSLAAELKVPFVALRAADEAYEEEAEEEEAEVEEEAPPVDAAAPPASPAAASAPARADARRAARSLRSSSRVGQCWRFPILPMWSTSPWQSHGSSGTHRLVATVW